MVVMLCVIRTVGTSLWHHFSLRRPAKKDPGGDERVGEKGHVLPRNTPVHVARLLFV